MIDDGTVTRVSEDAFRWTAADPSLRWFTQNAIGLDVAIEDISEQIAALALQGPTSGRLLDAVADADIRGLKYFRMTRGTIAGVPVEISRTGYTGDLGYEIWMPWDRAVDVWDALMLGGRPFDIHPAGMLALDVARVEAGLLLIDVDFFSSKKALIESQKYSPFEMGLGRLVQLDTRPFVGRAALGRRTSARADAADRRPRNQLAGRRIALRTPRPRAADCRRRVAHAGAGLPRRPPGRPRDDDDLVAGAEEADRARDVAAPHVAEGTALEIEITVEAVRHRVPATVVKTPFFNPARKTGADRVTGMAPQPSMGPEAERERRIPRKPSSAAHAGYLDGQIEAFDALVRRASPDVCAATCCRSAATPRSPTTCCRKRSCRFTARGGPISPGRPVTPWVYAIARHVYLMKRRSAGRRVRFEERLAADARASDVPRRCAGRSPTATRCAARCARCRRISGRRC